MTWILDRRNAQVLARLASGNSLLAFDFDGTLAPIVEDRTAVSMGHRTAKLFERLCEVYPCAVISGRSRKDVLAHLGAARPRYVIGNHGAESGDTLNGPSPHVRQVAEWLETALVGIEGVDIEVKELSLAIHYRRAPDPDAAGSMVEQIIAAVPTRLRMVGGKRVWNTVPASGPSKADALLAARSSSGADCVIYVGDDITDEDVFVIPPSEHLVTVRVGRSEATAAAYYLNSQLEIDRLLRSLLALRVSRA